MAVNIGGLVSVILFYLAILLSGMWAAFCGRRGSSKTSRNLQKGDSGKSAEDPTYGKDVEQDNFSKDREEGYQSMMAGKNKEVETMLAGRNIGWVVGSFTMTATWVGGGFINGTAEAVYDTKHGLIWTQAPWGYSFSLFLGGLFFAKIMRSRGYITMLDPLQEKFGCRMGGLLYLPALVGETFWSAAILAALGSTITVILEIPNNYSVVISAFIVVLYTIFGGLYSVAYTDVIQLISMFIGLWICVPFVLTNEHVERIDTTFDLWKGNFRWGDSGIWIDYALLLMFGGIPWQVYFQRVLSSKSVGRAVSLSFSGGLGCLFMSIPAILLGAAARSVDDWTKVGYSVAHPQDNKESKLILPLVLQHLTPPIVSWIGLGAVSAAVMSSADSSVLSASTMFTRNVYNQVFRPKAGPTELGLILKASVFCVGTLATVIALSVDSVFALWVLCSDIVYVILFPNLVPCLFIDISNTYGSVTSCVVGLFFRLSGGVKEIGFPSLIYYPFYDPMREVQRFPFRTCSMLLCFFTLVAVSKLTHHLFTEKELPQKYDVFKCFTKEEEEEKTQENKLATSVEKISECSF